MAALVKEGLSPTEISALLIGDVQLFAETETATIRLSTHRTMATTDREQFEHLLQEVRAGAMPVAALLNWYRDQIAIAERNLVPPSSIKEAAAAFGTKRLSASGKVEVLKGLPIGDAWLLGDLVLLTLPPLERFVRVREPERFIALFHYLGRDAQLRPSSPLFPGRRAGTAMTPTAIYLRLESMRSAGLEG